LGFRKWKGADLVRRVLGGDDEEWLRKCSCFAFSGDLLLFHRFQQGTLCLRRGAVHLVGEDHLREYRAGVKRKDRCLPLENGDADDVRGQKIAGELNSLESQPQGSGQRVRKGRLSHPGNVFDQKMAASEKAGKSEADLPILAHDDAGDLVDNALQRSDRLCRALPRRTGFAEAWLI